MERKFVSKVIVYFLCVSFLLTVNGFHGMVAVANQDAIPIGQMISHGVVKFEIKENTWEKVETPFPVFEGMKIRTGRGEAVIALAEKTRIEIGSDSLFYFDQGNRLNLLQGKINFRMEPELHLGFKVGHLSIVKSYPLQTSRAPYAAPVKEEAIGSIYLHPKGSVTVRSIQGSLCVANQDQVVLASISEGNSITLPSIITSSKAPTMLSQAGAPTPAEGSEEYLDSSPWEWVAVGLANAAMLTFIAIEASKDRDRGFVPICP